MGHKRINADEEEFEFDESATVADLKDQVGASAAEIATYKDHDGTWVTLSDRDELRHVPDDATVAFQPETRFGQGGR